MKNIVRLFVVVLALTAAAASTSISAQVQPASSMKPVATKASAMPVPTCPPDDPQGCGIDGN